MPYLKTTCNSSFKVVSFPIKTAIFVAVDDAVAVAVVVVVEPPDEDDCCEVTLNKMSANQREGQ